MEKKQIENKLYEYYDGTLSKDECDEVSAWIDSSVENRKLAEKIYYICFAADTLNMMKNVDTDAALSRVHHKMSANSRNRFFAGLQRAAAILFIPLLAFTAYYIYGVTSEKQFEQMIEVRTTPGMTSSVILPDSTKVWLNSNTTIKYPVKFGKERNVELIGEAYFSVVKDPEHKFHVNTKDMQIEVVGTEFNVDTYEYDDRTIKTTLVKGAINMHYSDNAGKGHMLKIYPGQCVTMDTDNKKISVEMTDVESVSAWRYGKIILNRTSFADALRLVENRYNVQFIVKNPKLYNHTYTGQFTNQRLDSVLEHFSRSSRLKFNRVVKNGDSVSGREVIEVY